MAQLTPAQRVFIITKYLQTQSLQATKDAFIDEYPHRNPPAKTTIWKNVRKFQTHGTSLNRNKGHSGRRRTGRSNENIAAVSQQLQQNPRDISARRNGLGLPSATFNRITRLDLNQHPYRIHARHELFPGDNARRLQFSRWLVDRCNRDERFLRCLVIGDEAAFSLDGKVNTSNVREYAPSGQPPSFNYDRSISREKLNVWVGLVGSGHVIGPFFFEGNLNGAEYLRLINERVVPQLEQHFLRQPRGAFRYLWWAQDGAPAHRLRAVRNRLEELFGNRVIAIGHDVEWPPRSPDLTPCDFFLWGHLKSKVFSSAPGNLEVLRARIQQEIAALQPATIRRAVFSMQQRCMKCIRHEGGHVEGMGA